MDTPTAQAEPVEASFHSKSAVSGGRPSIVVAIVLLVSSIASAAPAPPARSMLRLQGYRGAAPAGARVVEEIVLVARGVEHRFAVTERRRFDVEVPGAPAPRERDRFTLQGDFDVLAKFSKTHEGQLVTILGEQRPGSGDLFILTLDLCPP